MDDLRERVAAVERALTDGEGDLQALAAGAASADRLDSLEADLGELQEDVAELEAATQALRGYVGSVRSVNESVEERADAALAAVDSLEERLPDEPKSEPASGESPSADAQPGIDSRDGTRSTQTGRSDGISNGAQCHACGQSVSETPAADGGRVPPRPGPNTAGTGGGASAHHRDRLQSLAAERAAEVAARLPGGVPVLPTPGFWYAMVNAWHVQVRGSYVRFVVSVPRGAPDRLPADLRYVRENRRVRLDVDGDGTAELLGRNRRITFAAETVVGVAVPPKPRGVGDAGEREERSPGWPTPGSVDRETAK